MGSRIYQELPALLALACEKSDAARLALASKLSDLFLQDDLVLNDREKTLINDLIADLLRQNDPQLRQALAKTFACAHHIPRDVALPLAQQDIDVAGDILKTCTALSDDDLITIIASNGSDHAIAIAKRAEIAEAVADALVTTGDVHVMQAVAENLGAHLSPQALGTLVEAARLVRNLQTPILNRPELTPATASKLYWWLEQDARREALARFGFSAGMLDQALAKAIDDKLNEHALEKFDDTAMERIADWLNQRGALNVALLPKLLRLGYFRLFSLALARLCVVDSSVAEAIVNATGGAMMAALCKSLGIDKAGFVSIFLLSRGARSGEHIVHPRELSEALVAFDRLSETDASSLVLTWREKPEMVLRETPDTSVLEA